MRMQDYSVRKVGEQPSKAVVDMLRRRHPTVRLMWARNQNRWALVQVSRLGSNLIKLLQDKQGRYERPTMKIVYDLDQWHPARLCNRYAIERLLRHLDSNPADEKRRENAKIRIADGSRELWNAINRKVIARRG